MSEEPLIRRLLQEMIISGRALEEVCRDHPELANELRARWRHVRGVQEHLDVLFPSSEGIRGHLGTPSADLESPLPQIAGYEVQSVLGHGGMGVVYKAQHLTLNRPVALKMVLAGVYSSASERRRLLREAQAVATLHHPNIVTVHDVGELEGRPYFTMEFVDGTNLAQRLAGAPQPARDAAALVATLADAMHSAHRAGIVHRDLKPANVLLTADGTPKITDFGLAGPVEGDAVTMTGAHVGTPSYMAPEQARGDKATIGPATDVYGLGAILYELLTGRPPFRAETGSATLQQVITDEPAPPARLNPRVPRDLETICLKCLRKDPQRRYATAAELAADVRRFTNGEPITARRAGITEKSLMWVRRRPTAAALGGALLVSLVLGLSLLGGQLRAHQQRAAIVRAADQDLRELTELEQRTDWAMASSVLSRLQGRTAHSGLLELRAEVDRASAELTLAQELDTIRLNRAPLLGGLADSTGADRRYEVAFRKAAIRIGEDDPKEAAQRVRSSNIARTLVAALDDWAVCASDESRRTWCLEAARSADPGVEGWGGRLRDPLAWNDRPTLAGLAEAAPVDALPVTLLVAVGERLQDLGADQIGFLKRVDRKRPGDFGVNFRLGFALMSKKDPAGAVGYYRVALVCRRGPGAIVCNDLALALKGAGQLDEAIATYQSAIEIDPNYAPAHSNLGVALKAKGRPDEALACFERAVALDPGLAHAHGNLANALKAKGDLAGAMRHYEEAARLAPSLAEPHYSMALVLKTQGRDDEAIERYREALRIAPTFYQAHSNLGRMLMERKQWDLAIEHLQRAVDLAPQDAISQTGLGEALLAVGGQADRALNHLREGVRLEPDSASRHGALGKALLSQGLYPEAMDALRRCLELMPTTDPRRPELEAALIECKQRLGVSDEHQ